MHSYKNTLFCFVFLFIFQFALSASNVFPLSYSIRPIEEGSKHGLEVCIEFQGNRSGTTALRLPSSWAGQNELHQEIKNLRADSSKVNIKNTGEPEIKHIVHRPNEIVQICYEVFPREKQQSEWYYRPIIEQSHFYFIGHSFFAIPEFNHYGPIPISLQWEGFPSDWSIANSFGAQQTKQELFLPLTTFLHAAYAGGDFQLLACGKDENQVYIAIRGEWSFSNDHLVPLVQEIIQSQRDFWNDYDFPYYLITILPIGKELSIAGTGLSNAFSLFMGEFIGDTEQDWKSLTWLLSHEHFHTWNGIKMIPATPNGPLFWFSEGFTEYYAAKLNHRAHLINSDDYIEHVNMMIYDYYASPVHDAPNARIELDFWNDFDVQRLPYTRGFLFAFEWDKKIQKISRHQHSLDDFMWTLFSRSQKNNRLVSLDTIEQVASIYLPQDSVKQDITDHIINGQTIIPSGDFDDSYVIQWNEDIGFNFTLSNSRGNIEGVKEHSRAYQAGLRNGQLYIDFQTTDKKISVRVVNHGGRVRTITYSKDTTPRLIPQYVSKD